MVDYLLGPNIFTLHSLEELYSINFIMNGECEINCRILSISYEATAYSSFPKCYSKPCPTNQ